MCTISFIPTRRGFYLAMNRDEKRARPMALPPVIMNLANCRAILPHEPSGGTWIAANDHGICVALINWHRIKREPSASPISRGEVVLALAGALSADDIESGLAALNLCRLRPFRLIAIVSSKNKLTEWRWDLKRLSAFEHPWLLQHWFSSGFDEEQAELKRKRVCNSARNGKPAGTLMWLRRLHRSHLPAQGPFSICMHRKEAATVSYTEIAVSARRVLLRYKPGPACSRNSKITKALPRVTV
jgi:hypothetical protein